MPHRLPSRLDLRPVPVFEKTGIGYLRTHYYGGVRKYQWPTIPLALHGVIYRADGTKVNVCIGEKGRRPCVLHHRSAAASACQAERQDAGRGHYRRGPQRHHCVPCPSRIRTPEQRVKLNVLGMLNEAYGITERDFTRAEIEVVLATRARDIGLGPR